jgi:hypothetical protein
MRVDKQLRFYRYCCTQRDGCGLYEAFCLFLRVWTQSLDESGDLFDDSDS